jgi:hypothetical protein
MIAGVSRFSRRQVLTSFGDIEKPSIHNFNSSIVATVTFFTTAVITAQMLHCGLPPVNNTDWTLGTHGKTLLEFQTVPLTILTLLYFFVCSFKYPNGVVLMSSTVALSSTVFVE